MILSTQKHLDSIKRIIYQLLKGALPKLKGDGK